MEKLDELRTDERGVLTVVCMHPDCQEGRHAFFVDPVERAHGSLPLSPVVVAERPRLWVAASCRDCHQQIRRAAGDASGTWRTVIDGETVGNVCTAAVDGHHVPVDVAESFEPVGL